MRGAPALVAALLALAAPGGCGSGADDDPPLNPNAGCCVCHIPFIKEPLSTTHLEAKVTCVRCHGASIGHANDEHIGATPPDVKFAPGQVNPFCRACHEKHDVPPEAVVARWQEVLRARPAAAASPAAARCTDCHGRHRIERAARAPPPGPSPAATPEPAPEAPVKGP